MHVIQKQYGIFITINHCPFELKAAQKKINYKITIRMTEAGLILFRPSEKYHDTQ